MFNEGSFTAAGAPELDFAAFSVRIPEAELPRLLQVGEAPRTAATVRAALAHRARRRAAFPSSCRHTRSDPLRSIAPLLPPKPPARPHRPSHFILKNRGLYDVHTSAPIVRPALVEPPS